MPDATTPADAAFDPRALRNAFGRFATGVTIITCLDAEGRAVGLTANSFTSLSMEPPLVLWSLRSASPSVAAFAAASHFTVNVLGEAQLELSRRFASRVDDKFAEGLWAPGLGGAPVLALATVLGLGGLLQAWWSTTVRGDGAAVVTPLADADGQVRALRISGTLGMGSTQALQAALQAHPQVQRLEIHSPGGLVTEGHGMAQLALQRALNTEARVACEAACTLVFVAGQKRLIAREASLGFGGLLPSLAPVVADFYRQRGVPEDFVQQALGRRSWQAEATATDRAVAAGLAQPAP